MSYKMTPPSNEAVVGDNVNLVDILPPIQLQEDMVAEKAALVQGLIQETFWDHYDETLSQDELHEMVNHLAERLIFNTAATILRRALQVAMLMH